VSHFIIKHVKVLVQSYSSDRQELGNPENNPTSTINHPSTTIPPEKTGNPTEFEKGQSVALKEKSVSFSKIGKILSHAKSTILSFYHGFQKRGDVKNLPMPGRHKIINTRTDHSLVRESNKVCSVPLSELRNEVVPHASVKTIKPTLASVKIKKWSAIKRAFLKGEHAVKRLAWAKKYKDWTQEDFEGVIFSDDCMVAKSKDLKTIWVFRTPEEKWHKDCIHEVTKGPGIKLMVWACIWGKNKGPLIPIFDKSVNRFVYIGVWEDGLVDVWQEVEVTVGDPIFQQDGAKIHTARDAMACLAENNIQVIEWPLNSPDLNPIEHCRKRLKEKLHPRFPNIHKTKEGPDTIRRYLAEALDVRWT